MLRFLDKNLRSPFKLVAVYGGGIAALVGLAGGSLELVVGIEELWPSAHEEGGIGEEGTDDNRADAGIVVLGDSVEAIRVKNEVRPLNIAEEGKAFSDLPNGVYGYEAPWLLKDLNVDSSRLSESRGGTVVVEVHKSSEGEPFVVGFISTEHRDNLIDEERQNDQVLRMVFEKRMPYNVGIGIPMEYILKWRATSDPETGGYAEIVVY